MGSKLGGLTAVGGRGVDGWGRGMADAGGTALGKEVRDVVRHGEFKEPGCTIVFGRIVQVGACTKSQVGGS